MYDVEDVKWTKDFFRNKLMKKKNVIGLGCGLRYKNDILTDDLCLITYVQKKEKMEVLSEDDLVPSYIGGVNTDVIEIGRPVIHQSRLDKWRPAPGGVSIGHYAITAGTFGVVVKDATSNELLILSNNHVLANSNSAPIGDLILQPGPADGGDTYSDVIGRLNRFVKINFDDGSGNGSECPFANYVVKGLNFIAEKVFKSDHRVYAEKMSVSTNTVDAAAAKPNEDSDINSNILDIGVVKKTKAAALGMKVKKSGRTTGFTQGTVTSIDTIIQVGYGAGKVATFEKQIVTSSMSKPGDSGSLLVEDLEDAGEGAAIGLLFAGSDTITIHNPIDEVFNLLRLKF